MRARYLLVALSGLALACETSPERPDLPRDGGSGNPVRDAGVTGTDSGIDGGTDRDGGAERDGGDERDGGMAVTVPDPATGPPNGAILFGGQGWDGEPFDNATPMTAVPLGTVDAPGGPLYIQDDTSAWFVFIAGANLTQIGVELFVQPNVIRAIHLHDVENLVLGGMVTPIQCAMGAGSYTCSWMVTPGNVYVLEITLVTDQFF